MGGSTIEGRFTLKTKIYFNKDSLMQLKEVSGTRAFIVSDPIMEKLGYLQKALNYLNEAGISSKTFTGVRPDPDIKLITDGLKLFNDSGADILIALGGGSAIDTAKAILFFAQKFTQSIGAEIKKPLFIAIPSTSGTGSEVTDFSVVTASGEKVVIIDEEIAPDIAILDSTCIENLPKHIVADTGIDVLVHAVEAYVSTKATDFTDALAEKAITLLFENLETLYKDTKNEEARNHVHNASCIAGIAFTNAGLGINHSLAHAMGGAFHIPHGRCNAVLLNAVIEYNADLAGKADSYATERYAKLAAVLHLPARTRREGTVSFLSAISKLKKAVGMEDNIKSLGIGQEEFESILGHMAESALNDRCTPTNPRKPAKEELLVLFRKCYG